MIIEYHRPETLEQALDLLSRSHLKTVPLAGGTALNRPSLQAVAAVDLQALGLNGWERRANTLEMGATLTLQALQNLSENLPLLDDLRPVIGKEGTYNLRQLASLAGAVVAADGRSPLVTALLALDADIVMRRGAEETQLSIGDLLPLRSEHLPGALITHLRLPLNARLSYHAVGRSPADRPIVCAAAARWPSGRTRLALGGWGPAPILVLDGPEPGGAQEAASSAYSQAGDEWASAEYRSQIAGVLARRCLETIPS